MLFSKETSVLSIAKKQYLYKLKAYMWFIFSLLPLHVLALLLSLNGVASSSSGGNFLSINMKLYSNEIFITLTFIWIFFGSVTLTTGAYRTTDFTFVSNRLSSNLSNIFYMLTLAVLGSITSFLSGYLLRFIVYFISSNTIIINEAFTLSISELVLGIIVTALYLSLLSAIGYSFAMLVQLFKPFVIILPALFFWSLLFRGESSAALKFLEYLVLENSLLLFTLKILTIVLSLYSFSILISKRMEVR